MSTTSGEEIRGWIQTSAIIIAGIVSGIWATYEFYYKEYYVPKSAPINITMDLELKRIDQREIDDSNAGVIFPVQIKVVARNPSTRPIYLLSSAWWAYGLNVERHKTDKTDFDKSVVDALNSATGEYAERYTNVTNDSLIAAGSLFINASLKPAEIIIRTLIIYLPPRYDKLKVVIKMPASGKDPEKKLALLWDRSGNKILYRIDEKGKRRQILESLEDSVREFELQFSEAISETSLRH